MSMAAEEAGRKVELQDPSRFLHFLEVTCKSSGKIRRFAAGTEAGFALNVINQKLGLGVPPALHIEAAKEGEEPVSFGPNAVLVNYGEGWKLQTFIEEGFEAARLWQPPKKMSQMSTFDLMDLRTRRTIAGSSEKKRLYYLDKMADKGNERSGVEGEPSTKKYRGPYEVWSQSDDYVMLSLLAEEVRKGSKMGNCTWRVDMWPRVLKAFKDATGRDKTKDNVLSRQKTWKKQYRRMASMLSKSGWSWDETTETLSVEDDIWKEFVKENKDAESFRQLYVRNYKLLHTIIGANMGAGNTMSDEVGGAREEYEDEQCDYT